MYDTHKKIINENRRRKAKFLMVDGLDGSGKGFIVNYLENLLKERNFSPYDIRTIGRKDDSRDYFPEFSDIYDKGNIRGYRTLIFMEPSDVGVGHDLRKEIFVASDRKYPVESQAMAFALQREILYKRLLIKKALDYFDFIIAERGFTSSIAFQPLYSEMSGENPRFGVDDVLKLQGNRIALNYIPDFILIADVDAKTAMQRLNKREKKDNAIYEKLKFQTELRKIYTGERSLSINGKSMTLKDFLEKKGKEVGVGTKYILLSTDGKLEDTEHRVKQFLDDYLILN